MAKERWFTGFEDANVSELSAATGAILCDGTARSGDFYAKGHSPQGGGPRQFVRTLVNSYTCAAPGDTVVARQQICFRVVMYPGTRSQLVGFGNGTTVAPNQGAVVMMQPNGSLEFETSVAGPFLFNWTPVLNKWYVARVEHRYTRGASTTSYTSTCRIYDGANDAIITTGPRQTAVVASVVQSGSLAFGGWALSGQPTLGPATGVVRIVDYDDWWISCADGVDSGTTDTNWPSATRVQTVPITGQGTGAAWTGDYRLAWDTPNTAVANDQQTTTTPSALTTFTHQTAAQLGLIPVGQLEDATTTEQTAAPPFTGLPAYEGITSGARTYTQIAQDLTLPTPSINQFQLTAGAGQFNSGVWVRAFQIEWRSQAGGSMIAVAGPMTSPVFFSASAAPNFAALIDVTFNPSTPQDRFLNPSDLNSGYRRYGLGLIVTNAYNNSGLLNPFTDVTNTPGSQTNTTNLSTYGGPGAIDAGPWGSLVALISAVTPGGTLPPYANTNPFNRPTTVRFNLSSPRPAGTSATTTTTNLFGPIFMGPAETAAPAPLPIVEGIKVVAQMQLSAGTQNQDIMIGGTAFPVSISSIFGFGNQQFAIDWTNRDAASFDALQFGARANAALGATLRLGQCIGQVLTSGPTTRRTVGNNQYQHHCGIYTGNGTFQDVNVGFKPTAIIIKKTLATASPGAFKAWWMGGTQSWNIDNTTAPSSTGIQKITDTGFTVGVDATCNTSGQTYAYVAIKDGNEDSVNDAYCVTGSYFRQSSGDPDLTVELPMSLQFASSWTPDVVVVWTNTTMKTPDMVAPNSDEFATTNLATNGITAIGDKTFDTGSFIGAAGQHAFIAWKFDAGGLLEQVFDYGSFAGTGGAQTITVNFMPEMVFADTPQNTQPGRWRSRQAHTGLNSTPWGGGANTTIDITALGALSFDVGTGLSANTFTTYWLAWKLDGAIGNTGSSNIPPPSGGDTPTGDPPLNPIEDEADDNGDGTPYALESEADRALRLANLCTRVLHRLGDSQEVIWTEGEIDTYLRQAALQIAVLVRLIWDMSFIENVPPGFNFTQEWERRDFGSPENEVQFDYGVACCTYDWELEMADASGLFDSDDVRYANNTNPAELLHIVNIGSSVVGEAVRDVPVPLIELERATWDERSMDALSPRDLMEHDTRFEVTQGEVFAFTWRKDGNRKFRKVRVPNSLPLVLVETDGGYGIARNVNAVSDSDTVTGTWGIPRRIRGWHPFGNTVGWGMPRRFFYSQLNVKIEFWRKFDVECRLSNLKDGEIQRYAGELPRRYFMYMADYCQWKALVRQGPGQDYKLAELYKARWERNLGRLGDRVNRRDKERLMRLGGNDPAPRVKPPRPRLPWQYGKRIR